MEAVGFSSLGWDAWFTMGTVVAVFLCVVLTRLSADTVFLGGTGLLMVVGVLDAKEALAGFSSSGMVTVGVLYVVVSGLQETGALLWISSNVLGRPTSVRGAQSRVMFPVLLLSGFLNNTRWWPCSSPWFCNGRGGSGARLRCSLSRLALPPFSAACAP